MAPPVVLATAPVRFIFERSGGAVVHARLAVWSGVGTPEEKRVLVLFFEDSMDDQETFTRSLPQGIYSCVLHVFVREDLHGVYAYKHLVGDTPVADDSGDVNTGPTPGEGLANKHEYVLSIN
jgi:hypothetical protein